MTDFHLRYYRNVRRLSQTELAKQSSVNITTIQRIENGHTKNITHKTMMDLSLSLGIPPWFIFFPKADDFYEQVKKRYAWNSDTDA